LTKEGAEKLKLMAENKFDRGLDLKEGTLVLGDDKCLGTGTLACKGGDLEALGERKIPNPVEFEGDTKISGDKLTFAEEAKAKENASWTFGTKPCLRKTSRRTVFQPVSPRMDQGNV